MMMLAEEAAGWLESLGGWGALAALLQVVVLAYVVFGFRRIARNQVELAEYVKRLLDRDE